MPNYRYNTPDYMRQNHSNGCHVGGSNRTMPASVSPSTPSRSVLQYSRSRQIKRASQLLWPMFRGRSGVLSMKSKKDSGAELFLRN